jgi:hypothetical protein
LRAQKLTAKTEIHQLDGDRKTFVYENYNKFLTAADAIKIVSRKTLSRIL